MLKLFFLDIRFPSIESLNILKRISLFILLLIALLISSCKKDNSIESDAEENQTAPFTSNVSELHYLNFNFRTRPDIPYVFNADRVSAVQSNNAIYILALDPENITIELIIEGSKIGKYPLNKQRNSIIKYKHPKDRGFSSSTIEMIRGSIEITSIDTINKTLSGMFTGDVGQYSNHLSYLSLLNGSFTDISYSNSWFLKSGYYEHERYFNHERFDKKIFSENDLIFPSSYYPETTALVKSSSYHYSLDDLEIAIKDSSLVTGNYSIGKFSDGATVQVFYYGGFDLAYNSFSPTSGNLTISEINKENNSISGTYEFDAELIIDPQDTFMISIKKGKFKSYFK